MDACNERKHDKNYTFSRIFSCHMNLGHVLMVLMSFNSMYSLFEFYCFNFVSLILINTFSSMAIQLLSAGLEPVLSQTEKSCIALIYRHFSTRIAVYNTMR